MLETVSQCPMCRSEAHHIRFDAVPDFVFRATDELWTISECDACHSLFLPRRPGTDTIGRYYERYYTHDNEAETPVISGISVQSGLAKKLANSWRNHRYGSNRPSLGIAGVAAALAFPPLRGWIDAECRHLPTDGATPLAVLDVGHGDARFLRLVREIGHQAAGVEIDPKAVAQARADGLDVHQGDIDAAVSIWGEGHFDYITMSHVIEHVHDPRHVIRAAHRLLRPGGRLWIECPNPESQGLAYYGKRWRDLDPPRHLCIPSLGAMRGVAKEMGFAMERLHRRPFVSFEVYPFSAVASGGAKRAGYARAAWAEATHMLHPSRREWLTVTFRKG
jgi:SAM-dependent methyltransferase